VFDTKSVSNDLGGAVAVVNGDAAVTFFGLVGSFRLVVLTSPLPKSVTPFRPTTAAGSDDRSDQ